MGIGLRPARGARWLSRGLALILILPLAMEGANAALLSAVASILYLGWAAVAFARLPSDTGLALRMAPVAAPLLLLLAWVALPLRPRLAAGLVSPPLDPDLLGVAWCHAFSLVALLLAAAHAGRLRGFARMTARWLCLFAAILMTATLALRAFGSPELLGPLIEDHRYHRFSGLIGNANAAGISYGMISLLMTGVAHDYWREWRDRARAWPSIAAAVATTGAMMATVLVALSQSRTAFAATCVAQIIFVVALLPTVRGGRQRLRRPLWAGALGMAAAALWLSTATVFERYGAVGDDGASRIAILRHYAAMAMHAPLSGYGLGGFAVANQRSLTPETVLQVGDFGAAHDVVLQFAIEAGWPAVALVAIALVNLLWRLCRAPSARTSAIGLSLLLAVAVAVAGSIADIALNVPAIAALCAVLLGLAWGRLLGRRAPPRTGSTETSVYPAPWPIATMRN